MDYTPIIQFIIEHEYYNHSSGDAIGVSINNTCRPLAKRYDLILKNEDIGCYTVFIGLNKNDPNKLSDFIKDINDDAYSLIFNMEVKDPAFFRITGNLPQIHKGEKLISQLTLHESSCNFERQINIPENKLVLDAFYQPSITEIVTLKTDILSLTRAVNSHSPIQIDIPYTANKSIWRYILTPRNPSDEDLFVNEKESKIAFTQLQLSKNSTSYIVDTKEEIIFREAYNYNNQLVCKTTHGNKIIHPDLGHPNHTQSGNISKDENGTFYSLIYQYY